MDIDLPKKFSPLYISRLIPPKVGKEGIAKLSRLCNTRRLLSPLVPQVLREKKLSLLIGEADVAIWVI